MAKRPYKNSPADRAADRKNAAKRGVSVKKWEGSAADRRMDAAAQKKGARRK